MKQEFIESICAMNGEIQNLNYHQKRVEHTFKTFFKTEAFQLIDFLKPLEINEKGKIKIRLEYAEQVNKVEFEVYQPKIHENFNLIEVDDFDYSYKYKNREFFKGFKNFEPLFIKNHQLTDGSYANLIFLKNNQWFTPETYLLNGTKRQFLLETGQIQTKKITKQNIFEFEKFGLINAMLDIGDHIYPIEVLDKSSS